MFHTPCHHDYSSDRHGAYSEPKRCDLRMLVEVSGDIILSEPLNSQISEASSTLDMPSMGTMNYFSQCNQFTLSFLLSVVRRHTELYRRVVWEDTTQKRGKIMWCLSAQTLKSTAPIQILALLISNRVTLDKSFTLCLHVLLSKPKIVIVFTLLRDDWRIKLRYV